MPKTRPPFAAWLLAASLFLYLWHVTTAFVPSNTRRVLTPAPKELAARRILPPRRLHVSSSSPSTSLPDMSLLHDAQLSSSVNLEEMTRILLDRQKYPVGSLSYDVLDASFAVLCAWTKVSGGVTTAQRILTRLEDEIKIGNDKLSLTNKHYSVVMDGLCKQQESPDIDAAERLLERLEEENRKDGSFIRPSRVLYNSIMSAHAMNGNINDVLRIFKRLPSIHINDYNVVLSAHAKNGQANECEEILQKLLKDDKRDVQPNIITYNCVLDAWAKSNKKGADIRAQDILNGMISDNKIQPNAISFASLAQAILKSENDSNIILERVESLLQQAAQHCGVNVVSSDAYLQTALLEAQAFVDPFLAQTKLLEQVHSPPNSVMYNTVLKAWRDSELDIAATKAEELLSIMEQQNLATDISYQTVMDCFANKNEPAKTEEIFQRLQNNHADFKPNARLHNVRIKAWAQSGHVERAEAILREMEDRNMTNSVSYSTVMHGWAKQNNVERTLEVFNRMRQMYESGNNTQAKPNYVSYVTLIDAIVKAGGPGAAQRSEDVLLDMVERYKAGDGDVKPTSWITTTVIDAWGKSGVRNAGEKAEALLDWLLEMFETNGNVDFMPGAVTFSAVVNAHARSRYFGKAVRARAVLQKMIDLYKAGKIEAKPNVFVFTGVINACAYTVGDPGEKADAMQIAASTFNELCSSEYGEPNHVCYSSYITAVRNLLPDGELKTKTAIGLFNKCREDGQVGDIVVKIMSSFLSPKQLEKIGLGHNAKALPKEWRCNVIDRRRSDKKLATS